MDFSPTSYYNNFDRKELVFWGWNIKVLGSYLTELNYYGTLICAPLTLTLTGEAGYVLFTPRSDSQDEGSGQTVKNEVMGTTSDTSPGKYKLCKG